MSEKKMYSQEELEAMLETTYAEAYAKGKNSNANTNEATKTGFFKGFNIKHNAIAAVVAAGAAAAGMYFLSPKCECDIPNAE